MPVVLMLFFFLALILLLLLGSAGFEISLVSAFLVVAAVIAGIGLYRAARMIDQHK